MKCLSCGSESLFAEVTVKIFLPLAARLGSVKIGGNKITQIDIKRAWDFEDDGTAREVKSPIICAACGVEHRYTVGAASPLGLLP